MLFELQNAKKADRDFTLYLPKNQKMYLSNSSKKQNSPNNLFTEKKFKLFRLGSPCWARTSDIMINSHALYRLS